MMAEVALGLFATAVFATIGVLSRALFKQMDKMDRLVDRIAGVEAEVGVVRAVVDERMGQFDERMERFEEEQRAIRRLLEQIAQRVGTLEAA